MTTTPAPAVVPPVLPDRPPLHTLAQAEFAETIPYGAVQLISTYGAPQAEYAAIRKATGLLDAAHRGILQISGKDRHAFLNNFLTNLTWSKDTKTGMSAGTGVYAYLLNGKGRVIADMNVLEVAGDHAAAGGQDAGYVLLETDLRLITLLHTSLEKYVFTEKVAFKSHPDLRVLSLHGPGSLAILHEAGLPVPELAQLASKPATLNGVPLTIFRDDPTGAPGYHLIVPAGRAADIWKLLSDPYEAQTNKRALRPVGWAMFNATRIEAGRPLFGIDFSEESLPAETGQFARAVSVTKGCYLGQEIVARMHARNQVAKQLVGLKISEDALPLAGTPVQDTAGNTVGAITSSTLSPLLGGAALALATIKKGFFDPGTILQVRAEDADRKATVTPLPFLNPTV